MTAIETVLWPGLAKLAPGSKLGGILARKPGYHNSRDHLPSTDYSVGQFAIDRQGPADQASAIDWTFPDAQAGDYRTIAHFSKLLLDAGRSGDRRTYGMREFFGQVDSDSDVEGWDFSKRRASTSDRSHLWHIHISVHRKYINDPAAMRSILAILAGAPAAPTKGTPTVDLTMSDVQKIHYVDGRVLALATGTDTVRSDLLGGGSPVWAVQRIKAIEAKLDAIAAKLGAQ